MHALAVSFDSISPAAERLNVVPPIFAKKTPPPLEAAFIGDSVITVGSGVTAGVAADAVTVATDDASADVGAITAEAITGSVLTYWEISRN